MAPGEPGASTNAAKGNAVVSRVRTHQGSGKYARASSRKVVYHGCCDSAVAETIFQDTCSAWGISSSDAKDREELKGLLAEALHRATSVEIPYDQITFPFNTKTLDLGTLNTIASLKIGTANPIRTWMRSYNDAEMPVRISDFLDTEENLEERQVAAAAYGTVVSNARFCFDTADALLHSGRKYSASEILLIRALKSSVLAQAQTDATVRGLTQPAPDMSGVVGGQTQVERGGSISVPTTTSEARTRFSAVR